MLKQVFKEASPIRIKPHKCGECLASFSHSGNLNRHKLLAHGERVRLKCVYCEYVTVHQFSLKKHFFKCKVETLLKCSDCNYYIGSSTRLQNHLSHHSTSGQFKYPVCRTQFKSYVCLRYHVLDQMGKTPYKCLCNSTFKQKVHTIEASSGQYTS